MKRSQMERKIANVLNNVGVIKVDNFFKAQAILDEIEKLGMLPPFSSDACAKSEHFDAPGYEWDNEKEGK